jgi:hypothetical protein
MLTTSARMETSKKFCPHGRTQGLAVSAAQWRAAERLAREYSHRRLETVLAAFVGDLAEAAGRPGSWEHERVSAWLSSHVWEIEPKD